MPRVIALALALLIAACATDKPPVLPGRVESVEIRLPDQGIVFVDWTELGSVANENGYTYTAVTPTSQRPTDAEIQELKDIEAKNSAYTDFVLSPEPLAEVQRRAVPELQAAFLRTARGETVKDTVLPAGPPLKLIVTLEYGRIGLRTPGMSPVGTTAIQMLILGAGGNPGIGPVFRGTLALVDPATNTPIAVEQSRFDYLAGYTPSRPLTPYENYTTQVWLNFLDRAR